MYLIVLGLATFSLACAHRLGVPIELFLRWRFEGWGCLACRHSVHCHCSHFLGRERRTVCESPSDCRMTCLGRRADMHQMVSRRTAARSKTAGPSKAAGGLHMHGGCGFIYGLFRRSNI